MVCARFQNAMSMYVGALGLGEGHLLGAIRHIRREERGVLAIRALVEPQAQHRVPEVRGHAHALRAQSAAHAQEPVRRTAHAHRQASPQAPRLRGSTRRRRDQAAQPGRLSLVQRSSYHSISIQSILFL